MLHEKFDDALESIGSSGATYRKWRTVCTALRTHMNVRARVVKKKLTCAYRVFVMLRRISSPERKLPPPPTKTTLSPLRRVFKRRNTIFRRRHRGSVDLKSYHVTDLPSNDGIESPQIGRGFKIVSNDRFAVQRRHREFINRSWIQNHFTWPVYRSNDDNEDQARYLSIELNDGEFSETGRTVTFLLLFPMSAKNVHSRLFFFLPRKNFSKTGDNFRETNRGFISTFYGKWSVHCEHICERGCGCGVSNAADTGGERMIDGFGKLTESCPATSVIYYHTCGVMIMPGSGTGRRLKARLLSGL